VRIEPQRHAKKSNIRTLLECWSWILSERRILKLGVYDLVVNAVAVSLLSLCLPVLANTHDKQAMWLGIWLSFFALGTTFTTITYAAIGHKVSSAKLLQLTPLGQAIGLSLLAWAFYSINLSMQLEVVGPVITLGMFIYGLNLGVGGVVDATVLQKLVPEDKRGTVFSVFSSLRYLAVPIGLLVSGIFLQYQITSLLFLLFILMLIFCSLLWRQSTQDL
jgi:hypothetical protein